MSWRQLEIDQVPTAGLLGSAVLVNRAELAAPVAALHEEWVVREHLPERVAVPGFLRGRRYVAPVRGEPGATRYVTLYETTDLAVLASPAYLLRLQEPTDLTRRFTGQSRAGQRTAAQVLLSSGPGVGGVLVLGAVPRPGRVGDRVPAGFTDDLLPRLAAHREVVGLHLCRSADEVTSAKDDTVEAALAPGRSSLREWLVLVELTGWGPTASVAAAVRAMAPGATAQSYRLQVCVTAPSA